MSANAARGATVAALPLSDAELDAIRSRMVALDLATDQVSVANAELEGKSLTCQQAAVLICSIKLRLLHVSFVRNTLKDKLIDLPGELHHILESLSEPMRDETKRALLGRGNASTNVVQEIDGVKAGNKSHSRTSKRGKKVGGLSPRMPPASPALPTAPPNVRAPRVVPTALPPNGIPSWLAEEASCIWRLRAHVLEGRVSLDVCEDLQDIFKYFELEKLQLPSPGCALRYPALSSPSNVLLGSLVSEISAPAVVPSDASTVTPDVFDDRWQHTDRETDSQEERHAEGSHPPQRRSASPPEQKGADGSIVVDLLVTDPAMKPGKSHKKRISGPTVPRKTKAKAKGKAKGKTKNLARTSHEAHPDEHETSEHEAYDDAEYVLETCDKVEATL